jgi:hypothetical protein
MFSGPYLITSVSHTITENGFDTTFEGTRQPFYALPKIESFIQSLSVKILKTIQEKIEEKNKQVTQSPENVLKQKSIVLDNVFGGQESISKEQNCSDKLYQSYKAYTTVDAPKTQSATFSQVKKMILDKLKTKFPTISEQSLTEFALFIFSTMYVDSGTSTGFSAYENNYTTIAISENYATAGNLYFNSKYFCVNKGENITNIPLASFDSLDKFIDFFISRFAGKSTKLKDGTVSKYVEVYVLNWPIEQPNNVYKELGDDNIKRLEEKFSKAFDIYKSVT